MSLFRSRGGPSQETNPSHRGNLPCRFLMMPQLTANIVLWLMAIVVIVLVSLLFELKGYQPLVFKPITSPLGNLETPPEILGMQTRVRELEAQHNELKIILSDEHNLTRATWSIESYCYVIDENQDRECRPCVRGWEHNNGKCYEMIAAEGPDMKTFDEAMADCQEKHTELALAPTKQDWDYICASSRPVAGSAGYWVGLRRDAGVWRWINGSQLDFHVLVFQFLPIEGNNCAICMSGNCGTGFVAANCSLKQKWICQTKSIAL